MNKTRLKVLENMIYRVGELEREIYEWRIKLNSADEIEKEEIKRLIESLNRDKDDAGRDLEAFQKSSESTWDELKKEIEDTWDDLKITAKKVLSKFK